MGATQGKVTMTIAPHDIYTTYSIYYIPYTIEYHLSTQHSLIFPLFFSHFFLPVFQITHPVLLTSHECFPSPETPHFSDPTTIWH